MSEHATMPGVTLNRLRRLVVAMCALATIFGCTCTRSEPTAKKTDADPGARSPEPPAPAEPRTVSLDGRAFPLLIASSLVVERDYFDRGRFSPRRQLAAALEMLGLHEPAFFGTIEGDAITVKVGKQERSFPLASAVDLGAAADLLEQILVFARDVLHPETEALHELEYAAINGFLAPLDPHTILLTPEENTELGMRTSGQYGGVGAEIASRDRRIGVVDVLPNTPAEAVGLLAGDLILKIGNQSTVNMTATEASQLVRGPVDSTVRLEIQRGTKRLVFTVKRQVIHIDSVRSAQLADNVAYVGLSHFQEDSAEKMTAALRDMGKAGPLRGIILDLRGNAGGLLSEATEVLDLLVEQGELVIVHSSAGREALDASPGRLLGDEVIVVALIDEHSASASEIVSGAIKHLGRGLVLGRGSFGKGSVQKLVPLELYDKHLAIKQTIAEYKVAGERKIQTVGVSPDLRLHPVQFAEFPGVAQYYDDERFERARERFQTASLHSAIHERGATTLMGRPGPLVRYLAQAQPVPEGELTERLMADPEIRLSHHVVSALARTQPPKTARRDLESALMTIATELRDEEDDKIVAEWKKQRVDWRPATNTESSPASLKSSPNSVGHESLQLEARLLGKTPVTAGAPFSLELTVRNEGSQPVPRVRVMTDCPYDELDGIEVMFGRIEPGATEKRSLSLEVMTWHPDFSDQLTTALYVDEDERELARQSVRLDVQANIRPHLAFDYWIVDDASSLRRAPKRGAVDMPDDGSFAVSGNGDGMLAPNEHVLIAFRVYNRGPGPSQDTRMMVQNLSGTQGLLEEGLFDLKALAPGKSATGAFGFSVAPDASTTVPVELVLTAADARLRERSDHKFSLRVVDGRANFAAKRASYRVGEHAARLYNGADSSARVVEQLAPNTTVASVGAAGNWLAMAGPDGRRLWLPADMVQIDNAKPTTKFDSPPVLVEPPVVQLDPIPSRVTTERITLSARASHPLGIQDVVAFQRDSGPASRPRKIHYVTAAHSNGEPFAFTFEVRLEPGGNRISIEARDHADVVGGRDVWIYRDSPP